MDNKEIDDVIKMLDGFAASDVSRLKVEVSDELGKGESRRAYHHGRCDIGSPWACGDAFDAQTER